MGFAGRSISKNTPNLARFIWLEGDTPQPSELPGKAIPCLLLRSDDGTDYLRYDDEVSGAYELLKGVGTIVDGGAGNLVLMANGSYTEDGNGPSVYLHNLPQSNDPNNGGQGSTNNPDTNDVTIVPDIWATAFVNMGDDNPENPANGEVQVAIPCYYCFPAG